MVTKPQAKSTVKMEAKPTVWTRNEVIFMGRLGRDPEMIYTTNGNALTKFSIAVNQGKDKAAMWLNITCWKELAEEVNGATKKGDLVEVKGRLSQRTYQEKTYHEVIAETVEVIESRQNAAPAKTGKDSKYLTSDDSLGDLDDHPF